MRGLQDIDRNSLEFKNDMEKRLIAKVCEHELLYAVDAVDYRDRHMRAMAWSEIGRDLGIPAAQCKDMWRKLRNCYLNAINRRQTKNIPKWRHEDEMAFLLPFIDVRSSSDNNENPEQSSSLGNVSASYNHDNLEDDVILEDNDDGSEMILPETSTAMVTKIEQPDDYYTPHPKRMRSGSAMRNNSTVHNSSGIYNNSLMLNSSRMSASAGRDEIEMFFLSMSETVKRLPAVDQAKIKMELCKMVYEAEIRALEEAQYEETL